MGHPKFFARLSTKHQGSKLHPSITDLHFSLLHIHITKPAAQFTAPLLQSINGILYSIKMLSQEALYYVGLLADELIGPDYLWGHHAY